MISRRSLLTSVGALALMAMSLPNTARAGEPIPVVASFSILGDMVDRIGGEHVTLTTLVGRNGDAHVYQPTPKAARAVSEAKIMFMNGLEFEGWLERLSEAAAFKGELVVATTGIKPIAFDEHDDHDDHGDEHADHDDDHDDHKNEHAEHDDDHDDHKDEHADHDDDHDDHKDEHAEHDDHDDHEDEHAGHDHGAFDPHAWLSPKLVISYADNIAAGLAKADPANAGSFYENRAKFVAELEALDEEIAAMMATLPKEQRTVVTSHDAFQYFARDYGLKFIAPLGLSTESEASAKDVAKLIEQMREQNISAAFVENIADPRLLKQIANETGATIGGTLYPGALSDLDGPAPTYIELMRHNAATLTQALGS